MRIFVSVKRNEFIVHNETEIAFATQIIFFAMQFYTGIHRSTSPYQFNFIGEYKNDMTFWDIEFGIFAIYLFITGIYCRSWRHGEFKCIAQASFVTMSKTLQFT